MLAAAARRSGRSSSCIGAASALLGLADRARAAGLGRTATAPVAYLAWQLAGAVRNRAGGRPPLGGDAAADLDAGRRGAAVFAAARWHRAGVHFHRALPAAAHGAVGRLPDRRTSSTCSCSSRSCSRPLTACCCMAPGAPRVRAGVHYVAMNLAASVALPHRRVDDLRRHRHAQHGGAVGAAVRGRRSRTATSSTRERPSWPSPS